MIHPYEAWLAEAPRHVQRTGRPLVGLCFAQSLDGSLAARPGEPLALSGASSSIITHRLRAAQDAILIGIGTLLADDPQLTVRLLGDQPVAGQNPQPVVLDSNLRTPPGCRLLQPGPGKHTPWIVTSPAAGLSRRAALESREARLIDLPNGPDGGISLPNLLEFLAQAGISSLMVEGGARVLTSFLSENLFDWVGITIAPVFVGGYRAVQQPLFGRGGNALSRLKEIHYIPEGDDLFVWGKR